MHTDRLQLLAAVFGLALDNSDSDTSGLDTGDSVTEQYTITVSDGALSDTMTVTISLLLVLTMLRRLPVQQSPQLTKMLRTLTLQQLQMMTLATLSL